MRSHRSKSKPIQSEFRLQTAGWSWGYHLRLGPSRVNISGGSKYDSSQELVFDHLLRFGHIPLAVLEVKAETTKKTPSKTRNAFQYNKVGTN